jgi:CheY-like chemotaxis protein
MTKILLVEDDKSLREIYGVRLLAEGYDIVSAGDGEEALAMAIKERPSLIVSDVMMPKISGFDMLDILRSTTETRDIKVIMMTALSSEDQRQRGERLGADRYLVKSQVGIEDVVRTVHEVLSDLPNAAPTTPQPVTQQPQAAPIPQQQSIQQPAPHIPERPSVESLSPQPQPAAPAPAAPVANPFAPQSTAPVTPPVQPADDQQSAPQLPQPTAPFSSPVPRPSNLGDRIIHPLENHDENNGPDLAKLMEQELSATAEPEPELTIPTPTPQPVPDVEQSTTPPETPAPNVTPAMPADAPIPTRPTAPAPTTNSQQPSPTPQPNQPQPLGQAPVAQQAASQAPTPMSFPPTPPQQ